MCFLPTAGNGAREHRSIATARELAELIAAAAPPVHRSRRIHPATTTFQALRIAVNDELAALEEFINAALALLSPDGRLAIISFHSSEDRIVKQTLRALVTRHLIRPITKKPIAPTAAELLANPRSRSARLRIAEKI